MYGKFDKNKYKKIVRQNHLSQKEIADRLTNDYLIETKIDAVKTWTRSENRNPPSLDRLNALADMCNCSIQDFFSDAEKKREQIVQEELSANPQRYSNSALESFLLSIPNGEKLKSMIETFLNLTDEQQEALLDEAKDMMLENLKFS